MIDRYEQVGLTRNPFFAAIEAGPPIETFVSRGLDSPPRGASQEMVQVIGDQGFGKSTHVFFWRSRHEGPYHYIPRRPYRSRWKRPPIVSGVAYGDEIDRMPRPLRWWWFRQLAKQGTTLVVGTHKDLGRLARRSGFKKVTTHILKPMDEETLRQIIERRIEQFTANNGQSLFRFTDEEFKQIFSKAGGNPRLSETVCHQMLAKRLK